jgi:hypothetical protein
MGCTKEGPFVHPTLGAMDIWCHPGPEAVQ